MTKTIFYQQADRRLFFDDPFVIAKHALARFPEECENIIRAADDVVSRRFRFNMRWDLERSEEYIIFDDEIDWLYQPGGDPEWVYAFNRMTFWICLGQAYALTRDEKYAHAFTGQLRHWVKTVPQTCEKAWRSIEVGMRLENWLKAIYYFEASPAINDEIIGLFCESASEHA